MSVIEKAHGRGGGLAVSEQRAPFPPPGLTNSPADFEQHFRLLVDAVSDLAIFMLDPEGRVVSWNAGAQRIMGYQAEQVLGQSLSILYPPQGAANGVPEFELAQVAAHGRYEVDTLRRRADGQMFPAQVTFTAIRDDHGQLKGYAKVTRDMTAQKAADEAIRCRNAQLEQYRIIVENMNEYTIYMLDTEGRVTSRETGAEKHSGVPASAMVGRQYSTFYPPEDVAAGRPQRDLDEAVRAGRCVSDSWRITPAGERVWSSSLLTALRDASGKLTGFLRVAHILTSQKLIEESLAQTALDLEKRVSERTHQLEASIARLRTKNEEVEAMASVTARDLDEKRVMLNEIHHRVKNNLQVVQSLLKMSVRSLPEGEARAVTMATAQRVFAMAMVHERLYQTKDLAGIFAANYLRDLFAGATDSNLALQGQVKVDLQCDEILLNLDNAIPFGLLVNELLSNCLKHAFPEGRKGTVDVRCERLPGAVRVVFQDDGIGLREGFEPAKCTSMGLKLASSLARQLGGKLEFSSPHGCRVETTLLRL